MVRYKAKQKKKKKLVRCSLDFISDDFEFHYVLLFLDFSCRAVDNGQGLFFEDLSPNFYDANVRGGCNHSHLAHQIE